jgi:hypothetical protein
MRLAVKLQLGEAVRDRCLGAHFIHTCLGGGEGGLTGGGGGGGGGLTGGWPHHTLNWGQHISHIAAPGIFLLSRSETDNFLCFSRRNKYIIVIVNITI